jgi:hypothetical protein
MFRSTARSLLLDYFGIPYSLAADTTTRSPGLRIERIERAGEPDGPAFLWPNASDAPGAVLEYRLGDLPLFARVASAADTETWLTQDGRRWDRALPIRDARGAEVAAIWRSDDGSVFCPFDPAEAMTSCWSEAYHDAVERQSVQSLKSVARRIYYRARPLLRRGLQIRLRRAFSRVQSRSRFPRWPLEPALHDLYDLLLGLLADVAGQPVPYLHPWPDGHSWALVLTHDVETDAGVQILPRIADCERKHGYRSAWYFVPLRYSVDDELIDRLWNDGFEVGVHGLRHDGRDFESYETFRERLPQIRSFAERWQAAGFRSPATHRVWDWMPELGFEYDTSYPDTDVYEPQAGGCCTWLPFFNRELVELPLTLPQDHTLFRILRRDEGLWLEKAKTLRARSGMAMLLTHPDYLDDEASVAAYERFLQAFADDSTAWRALPMEVARWWRQRAASHVEPEADGWRIVGPAAARGAIAYAEPATPAAALPTT